MALKVMECRERALHEGTICALVKKVWFGRKLR